MEIRTPRNAREWEAYYDLRFRILRQPWNQVRGSERNEADAYAIHLAYFEQNRILGVVRLDIQENEKVAQIRFMAVEEHFQGRGIGKKLILEAEKRAVQLGFEFMMLHAREGAVKFYESLNYSLIEKSHLLFGEIQHYRMEKKLV
jgi:ribosomal protein S18 acetylase RimI-like enzyme